MYIKGFDKNLKCRGMQFEVGKIYETGASDDELECCTDTVIHFCESLGDVHGYYSVNGDNRFCEVEPLGKVVKEDNKLGTNKIRIVREIVGDELNNIKGLFNGNAGLFNSGHWNSGNYNSGNCNSGNWNSGDYNSGDYNSSDYNSGYRNSGNWNSGNWNSGYRNSGNWNSGNYNSGDYNSGDYNSGNCNSGYRNSGNCNSGDYNSGYRNSGDWNSGNWNSCNRSTGLFNTKERTITIFNEDSGMTFEDATRAEWFRMLNKHRLELTEWIEYTDAEKKESVIRQCTGGYLKRYSYKKACANWWSKYTDDEKQIIMTIPNFDADVFEEITGIDVHGDELSAKVKANGMKNITNC